MTSVENPATTVTRVADFFVVGTPKPQGSKRAFQHPKTKRIVMTESAGAPLKDWRYDVKAAAHATMAGKPMIVQPAGVILTVKFILPRPVSLPKNKPTPLAVKRPDTDKLVRAVCDAMTGVVYADDSQVISMRPEKRIAELGEKPGARIIVESVEIV